MVHGLGPWGGPWTGSMGWSMDQVHGPGPSGGPWTPVHVLCTSPLFAPSEFTTSSKRSLLRKKITSREVSSETKNSRTNAR